MLEMSAFKIPVHLSTHKPNFFAYRVEPGKPGKRTRMPWFLNQTLTSVIQGFWQVFDVKELF